MILFWAVAALLAAGASVLILLSARRAKAATDDVPADQQVYARQLDEIEDLHARGLLVEEERRAARAEAGRRLLAAAERTRDGAPAGAGGRTGPLLLVFGLAAPLGALGLYAATGSPGAADQPFEQRLAAWRASDPTTLPPEALIAVAERIAEERPNEPEIWRLLGRARLQVGDAFGAVQALERAARIGGTAEDWEVLASALTDANNGEVGPEALRAYREALARDPQSVPARFGLAQAQAEGGDPAGAQAALRALAQSLPSDDGRRAVLLAEAEKLGARPPVQRP